MRPEHQAMPQMPRPLTTTLALILICLLGFGLRVYELDGQSMWSDEGLSYYRAQQPLGVVLENTITVDGVRTVDTNPPFYFLLLHAWRALLGDSVFVLRMAGVLAALFTIPLMYLLGRALFWRQAGIVAALFLALSPFHVWQTQVLRNYGLLITLNLLCVYGLVRYVFPTVRGGAARKWAALWLVAGLVGVYTHYFGFFVLAFTLIVYVVVVLARARARSGAGLRRLGLGLLLAALLSLPALLAAWARFRAGRQFDFYDVDALGVAVQAISVFSVGMSPTLTHPWWLYALGLLLFAAGIIIGWRLQRQSTLLLIGYQIAPLAMLLTLSKINPLFNGTRHLLIGLPPFLLLCALLPAGRWQRLPRRLALFLTLLFLAVQVVWLERQFHDTDFVRDDVRAVADYLNRLAESGDRIILHDTLIKFTFEVYYHGAAPVTAVPLFGQHNEDEALARFQAAAAGAERVWFLTHPEPRTGFPRDYLWRWADANWHRLATIDFNHLWLPLRLRAYGVQPERERLPAGATEQMATYTRDLTMHGLQMPHQLQSGQPFAVTFYLSQEAAAETTSYEISLRFLDGEGRLWQQLDRRLWPDYPPSSWPLGQISRYDHILSLPAGLPPGDYQVWMRLIDRQQDRPLSLVSGGIDFRLPDVTVQAATCEQSHVASASDVALEALFGSSLLLKGHGQPADSYRPGHELSIDVLWCILRPPREDVRVRARLVDEQGQTVAEAKGSLTRPDHPAVAWEAGELLQGQVRVVVPAATTAGSYELQMSVLAANGGAALPVNLGISGRSATLARIVVEEWPLETEFPEIGRSLSASFGQPALFELHGYELAADALAPGESVPLTFYWRSVVDAPPVTYDVFVHVMVAGQPPEAQADGPPLFGFRPTSSWRTGEVFVDERVLLIPGDATPGEYRLVVGLYNPDTGERLPAFLDGERQQDDAILLQPIFIAP